MATQNLSTLSAGGESAPLADMLRNCFSCGVITVDPAGKIVSLNPEAGRVLQLPAQPQTPPSLETLPLPVTSVIREVFATGQTAANRKIVLSSKDSEPTTLSVTALLVAGKKGSSVVAMLNDFSAAARLEQNLRRLDRLASVGTLSAGLAHEIKNALVAVKTFVDLLLEKNQDAELSATVRREIGRMDKIVGHMLSYSAPPRPAFAATRLHEILEHSLRMVQPRIGAKLVSVNREFRAPDDTLIADDHQLEQAFLNILFNAVDAVGENGSITVNTELVETQDHDALHDGNTNARQFRIRISDTGQGIAPENLPRIFEPFFTTKMRGTGLGLPIARSIIQEHQGAISLESRPGSGTTFTILLPAGPGPGAS